jgi:uncharacterized UBP type Zn finger protein
MVDESVTKNKEEELTPEHLEHIELLVSMGFTFELSKEAYLVSSKDITAATNYLFDQNEAQVDN